MFMEIVETITRCLHARSSVRLAVLFGSFARGDQRDDSDIDLGVRFSAGAEEDRDGLEIELGRVTGHAVDLILLDEAPPLLRFEIARDGVPVVQRDEHAWADFRARAMLDWWDWAPVARAIEKGISASRGEQQGHGSS